MHCMMDLETLGTMPGCAILSIGAVAFDPLDEPRLDFAGFYRNIESGSCKSLALAIEPATADWWERQSEDAKRRLGQDQFSLPEVALAFHQWFDTFGLTHLWCNGAGFDEPIWRFAINRIGESLLPKGATYTVPWKYWNVRDTRTLWDVAGIDARRVPREGLAHDALADARHQARCVQMAFAELRRRHLTVPPIAVETGRIATDPPEAD
jgi:hypothetical protein